GHEVPESIGVIGYDDSALARRARPGLTSVQQRAEVLGARAVELLKSRIGGRSDDIHDVVEPRLRVRASTRSPTTAAADIGFDCWHCTGALSVRPGTEMSLSVPTSRPRGRNPAPR